MVIEDITQERVLKAIEDIVAEKRSYNFKYLNATLDEIYLRVITNWVELSVKEKIPLMEQTKKQLNSLYFQRKIGIGKYKYNKYAVLL